MRLIYKDGRNDKIIGTTELGADGKVTSTGVGTLDEELMVIEPGTMKRLTPKDGKRWLLGLQSMSNGYCYAVLETVPRRPKPPKRT